MKKQLAITLGLAVISGSAFASKARLEALGEDSNGSQYLLDNRNIFLNPAHANYFKDLVTYETGSTTNNGDTAATPNAEGGFLRASGNMVYGVAFGNENKTLQNLKSNSGSTAIYDENVWDFFVAGDAGVQWGANLQYSDFQNKQVTNEVKTSVLRGSFGAIFGDTEAFIKMSLQDTAEEKNVADLKVKSNYDLGVSHSINGGTVFARYMAYNAEEKTSHTETWKSSTITVGYGKVEKLNDSTNLNYKLAYMTNDTKNKAYANSDEKSNDLAATIGLESNVKEWLALRASISQSIFGETEVNDKKKSTDDSTTVAAGASLIFGDFQIDGMIGNVNNAGTPGSSTAQGNGTLRTDTLLSRVSATYRF